MSRMGPISIPVAVFDPKESPEVVVQSQSKVGKATQDEVQVRVACSGTKSVTMMGKVRESQDSRNNFKEWIEEIDRDLKKFDKDEVQQLDTDMVALLGEASSSKHPKQ